jgi:hypothetical protein
MADLKVEIEERYRRFVGEWKGELLQAFDELLSADGTYLDSYTGLTSINAWRQYLIEPTLSARACRFFTEGQNDAIAAHVFARLGSWRASLSALRSSIENILAALFYNDHPVELRLWEQGRHRVGFGELVNYFRRHPDIRGLSGNLTGLDGLEREFGTLSRAVHGSGESFRMSPGTGMTNLWVGSKPRVGAWRTRDEATVRNLNLFLLALFGASLQGTAHPGLRDSIALVITSVELRAELKAQMGVSLG